MEASVLATPDQGRPPIDLADLNNSALSAGRISLGVFPGGIRNRLARDLHDTVGQSLFTLLTEIRVALDRGEAGREELLILEQEAQQALEAVRALAYRLRQRMSEDALNEARDYGSRLLGKLGRAFSWIDTRSTPRLAQKVAHALAWSIREAITNAIRHGAAAAVEVRLVEAEGRITVTIRDDGVGFQIPSLHPQPDGRGLGIVGSAERMAEVGGFLSIRSRPGEGTVVSLEAPRFLRSLAGRSAPHVQLSLDSPEPLPVVPAIAG